MSETVFCYSCWKRHSREVVVLVQSRGIKRWRCLRSIIESRSSRDRRSAFVRSVTELNRSIGLRKAMQGLLRPVLELFHGTPGRRDERP